jgi:hypothetical protein
MLTNSYCEVVTSASVAVTPVTAESHQPAAHRISQVARTNILQVIVLTYWWAFGLAGPQKQPGQHPQQGTAA